MDKEVLSKYIDYCRNERLMKPRSLTDYLFGISAVSNEIDLLKCTNSREVKDAILRLKEKRKWKARTTAKVATIIRRFCAWAAQEGIIQINPLPFHEFKKPPLPQPKFITQDRFDEILANPFLNHQERVLLMLLWDTGIRRGECATLDQEEIEFSEHGGTIHIPRVKSKGEYSIRYVPFSKETAHLLKTQIEWVRKQGEKVGVFLNSDWTRLSKDGVTEIVGKISKKFPKTDEYFLLTPHILRHSFAIRMLEKGVPELIVSKWLGHANLSMTHHYTSLTKETAIKFYEKALQEA